MDKQVELFLRDFCLSLLGRELNTLAYQIAPNMDLEIVPWDLFYDLVQVILVSKDKIAIGVWSKYYDEERPPIGSSLIRLPINVDLPTLKSQLIFHAKNMSIYWLDESNELELWIDKIEEFEEHPDFKPSQKLNLEGSHETRQDFLDDLKKTINRIKNFCLNGEGLLDHLSLESLYVQERMETLEEVLEIVLD